MRHKSLDQWFQQFDIDAATPCRFVLNITRADLANSQMGYYENRWTLAEIKKMP